MFPHRISRVRKLKATVPRSLSRSSSTYPLGKLRGSNLAVVLFSDRYNGREALPFKVSPENAILQMAPWASSACFFTQFLGSLGARYLPGFGFKPFEPVQLTPVYFPGWIIDAEAEVEVSYGNEHRTTTAIIHDSYLPGSDFRILSLVSFFSRQLGQSLDLVPFTKDLENQYGQDVFCLPYTISPFSIIDIAHSYADKVTVDENLGFSPSSLKMNLFAAYPVLFPLYLARYEFTLPGLDKPRSLTVFMEAFTPKGHISTEAPASQAGANLREMLPNAPKGFLSFTHIMDGVKVAFLRGLPRRFIEISSLFDNTHGALAITKWSHDILDQPITAQTLASTSEVSDLDNDPRVREFSAVERYANQKWMSMSGQIVSMKRIAESMENAGESGNSRIVSIRAGDMTPKEVFDGALKTLHEKIKELEAKRGEDEPAWWKEWMKNSKKKI